MIKRYLHLRVTYATLWLNYAASLTVNVAT